MWNNASHRRVRNLTQRHNKQTEAHCEGNFPVVFVKSTTQTRRCKCVIRAWRHYSFISGRFKDILRIVSEGHLLSNPSTHLHLIDRKPAVCMRPFHTRSLTAPARGGCNFGACLPMLKAVFSYCASDSRIPLVILFILRNFFTCKVQLQSGGFSDTLRVHVVLRD